MTDNRIAIIGGIGKTGGRVFARLRARGVDAYAASRSTQPSFDWTETDGWAGALRGATAAYVAYQPDLAVARGAADIAAFTAVAAESRLSTSCCSRIGARTAPSPPKPSCAPRRSTIPCCGPRG